MICRYDLLPPQMLFLLLDGCCPNLECESKQIMLIWKGLPDIWAFEHTVGRLSIEVFNLKGGKPDA
jgi:hypothetical protein